jgi:hypothetical protein
MSGPKVVRIVTREEIISISEGHLARLGVAVEEWIKVGRRNDTVTEAEISATLARQEELRRMLSRDRFTELQKAVPDEIAFLGADQEARLARVASEKAKARSAQRRTEDAAASLLSALDRRGVQVPAELRAALENAAAGRSEGASAISQAFALLSERSDTAVSERQRQLAEALRETDDRQSFNEWLSKQSTVSEDEDYNRLSLRLAELAVILGEEAAAEFKNRLRRIFSGEVSSSRSLLVDSLEVDLAQAVSKARERAALQSHLRMLAAELTQIGSESSLSLAKAILARIDETTEALGELEKEATEAINQSREEAAAHSRRDAILKGLAALGYQVNEGMETAWVRDGRVVIKRAAQPGYGVEIGGKVESGRMQMRTVAIRSPNTPADAMRDKDAETIFCGDVAKLQGQLAATGGGIVIERAMPIGATPLRVVTDTSSSSDEDMQERIPDRILRK